MFYLKLIFFFFFFFFLGGGGGGRTCDVLNKYNVCVIYASLYMDV